MGGRVDRASAFKTVDSGSIPGRVKPKTTKIGIHRRLAIIRESVKLPPACVVDKWQLDSKTAAVLCPRQLYEYTSNYNNTIFLHFFVLHVWVTVLTNQTVLR